MLCTSEAIATWRHRSHEPDANKLIRRGSIAPQAHCGLARGTRTRGSWESTPARGCQQHKPPGPSPSVSKWPQRCTEPWAHAKPLALPVCAATLRICKAPGLTRSERTEAKLELRELQLQGDFDPCPYRRPSHTLYCSCRNRRLVFALSPAQRPPAAKPPSRENLRRCTGCKQCRGHERLPPDCRTEPKGPTEQGGWYDSTTAADADS